jgi:hypothetical protein
MSFTKEKAKTFPINFENTPYRGRSRNHIHYAVTGSFRGRWGRSWNQIVTILFNVLHSIIFLIVLTFLTCLASYMVTGKSTMARHVWHWLMSSSSDRVIPDRMFTLDELSQYQGQTSRTPIYLAIK